MLCEQDGVARKHFQWNAQLCDRLKRETQWFLRWLLPGLAVAAVLYRLHGTAPLMGRLAMLAITLWIAIHIARALIRAVKANGKEILSTFNGRFQLTLALFFFAAAIGVVFGLRLSVIFVINTVLDTLQASIALAIGYSFLLHWLQIERRHLRFEELLQARETQSEQPLSELGIVDENKENLAELGEETRQLLNAAAVVVALSMLYFLWAPILPVFDAMSKVTLWTSTVMVEGQATVSRISLESVVFVTLMIGVTIYAARKLPALVELVLRSRLDVSAGTRYTVSTLLNYIILGVGILVALSKLGLDWSKLQWLVAALGVGIGFGLQEIVANFICGLIILFERPISVGDIITVGDQDGIVTRIRIRATTIRDWNNKELLIPNKEIITGRLLNWSLTDTRLRVLLPVGIAYGSDAALALKILAETVADDERVLADPAPSIIFSDFGESSLNMVCRFYIDTFDNMWPVKTALHLEIYRRFEEAGIVISFPQRDVHLDSEKPLRISIEPGPQPVA
jgi:potassium efflux system protein